MATVMDPEDGGLKFCYTKRGTFMPQTGKHKAGYDAWAGCQICNSKPCKCNGDVLPPNIITAYYAKLFAQQKKRGNLTERQADQEATQATLVVNHLQQQQQQQQRQQIGEEQSSDVEQHV